MRVLSSRIARTARAVCASPRTWLLFILLLAWGMRLFHLGAMSIWWDESLSYDRALQNLGGILAGNIQVQNVTTHDLHPPLYFLLLHYAVIAFGSSEFALRVLSTFANVLTVALLYPFVVYLARLGRLRYGRVLALLTCFLAALSSFYVWYAQEARPYALVLFWSLLAIYALLKMVRASPSTDGIANESLWPGDAPTRARVLLYLLALGATLTTHYLSFLLLPFHAAALLLFGWQNRRWRALALVLLGAFGLLLLYVTRGAAQLTGSDAGGATFVPFFIILRDVLNSFAAGVTVNLNQVAPLDLLLLGVWCLGLASTLRPRRRDYRLAVFLLAFFLLPPMALQLGSYQRPLYLNSRHLIITSPAFYIGVALGILALAQRGLSLRGRLKYIRRAALAGAALAALGVFIGIAIYSVSNLYFDTAYAKDDHRGWAEFLRERLRPDDILILNAPQAETVYRYYAPPGLKWISLPNLGLSPAEQERADRNAVVNAYSQHPRVWYLELHRPLADPGQHIHDLLKRWGTWLNYTYFSGTSTEIVLHEISSESPFLAQPPQIQHPLSTTFGGNLQLLGFDAPRSLSSGEHGRVKLYWELARPSGENYGVTLRLVDDAGRPWGQWDELPTGNVTPVSQWPTEQVVLENHLLPVDPGAPPGRYHLEVSVYRAETHQALALGSDPNSGETTLRLGDIDVTRPATPLDPTELVLDHHTALTLNDTLKLVGYTEEDMPVRPGDSLGALLYFQLLKNPVADVRGKLTLTPAMWAFWNGTRTTTEFNVPLTGRLAGDIVQVPVSVRVPGSADGGEYALRVALDGSSSPLAEQIGLNDIGTAQVASVNRNRLLPGVAHPKQARLGSSIEFLGYNLDTPGPVRPGDNVKLTLFWRATGAVDTSYTVFVHLLDANNQILGQNDSRPVNDSRETTSWAPGEVIADEHSFVVRADAPSGAYSIEIGMYNAADQTRLPVFVGDTRSPGDRILLDPVTVQ